MNSRSLEEIIFFGLIFVGMVALIKYAIKHIYYGDFYNDSQSINQKTDAKGVTEWLPDHEIIQKLQFLKPSQFEDLTAGLFRKLGYQTQITAGFGDEGIDIVAQKDGIKSYIQCKKLINNYVKVSQMRDFFGAITHRGSQGTNYFITTTDFSNGSRAFAQNKPIELINCQKLITNIKNTYKPEDFNKFLKHIEEEAERCPNCNGELVERHSRFGPFIGCSNYPRCHYKKKIFVNHVRAYSR